MWEEGGEDVGEGKETDVKGKGEGERGDKTGRADERKSSCFRAQLNQQMFTTTNIAIPTPKKGIDI